jgi:hypothetical protein
LPGDGNVGGVDLGAAGVAALPAGMIASVEEADAAHIADRVARMMPRVGDGTAGTEGASGAPAAAPAAPGAPAPKALPELLAAARPGRSLEIVSLDPKLRRSGALAVHVGDPTRIDGPALEASLLSSLTASFGPRLELAFTGPAGERTLTVPFLAAAEWSLTILTPRPGAPFLVIATSPTVAKALAKALEAKPLAHLLDADAALAYRIDVADATARWQSAASSLAGGPWPDAEGARFVTEEVPALLAAAALTQVAGVGYRVGDYRVEQVDFLW